MFKSPPSLRLTDLCLGERSNYLLISFLVGITAWEEPYGLCESPVSRTRRCISHCLWTRSTGPKYQKQYYDKRVTGERFCVGDKVWLYSPAVLMDSHLSFISRGKDPIRWSKYIVISDVTFQVKLEATVGKQDHRRYSRQVVHFNRLHYHILTLLVLWFSPLRLHQIFQVQPTWLHHQI